MSISNTELFTFNPIPIATNTPPIASEHIKKIAGPILFYVGIALATGGLGAFTYFSIGAPWHFLAVTLNPFRGDLMLIQIYVGNIINQLLYSAATTVVGSLTAYVGRAITPKHAVDLQPL